MPLEHLWATWRSAYVGQVVDSRTLPTPEDAQGRLVEALQIVERLRSRTGTAYYVSAFADLAARRGELELAVRLFAAAGGSVPVFARDRERTLVQARELHGEAAVAELERAGRELGLEAAAGEALAWAKR